MLIIKFNNNFFCNQYSHYNDTILDQSKSPAFIPCSKSQFQQLNKKGQGFKPLPIGQ